MDVTLEQILNRLLTLVQERDQLRLLCEQLQAERDALVEQQSERDFTDDRYGRRAEATG